MKQFHDPSIANATTEELDRESLFIAAADKRSSIRKIVYRCMKNRRRFPAIFISPQRRRTSFKAVEQRYFNAMP